MGSRALALTATLVACAALACAWEAADDDSTAGDPMPDGYIDRYEWARVHLKAGLRQRQCPTCKLWLFPKQKCGCQGGPA